MTSVQYSVRGRTAKQIADSVEAGISSQALTPGARLASIRVLAAELGVAPGTVASAYTLLGDRGLVSRQGRSTCVSLRPPLSARSTGQQLPPGVVDLASGHPDTALLPALRSHPARTRRTAAAPADFAHADLLTLGRQRLEADGVPAAAMTVTSGGLDAFHRLLTAHLRPGDCVAIEDPGWPNALDLVAALGLRAQPLALDAHGPDPLSLRTALRVGASAVIVTSRAQNPTGAAITGTRARELRGVLADHPGVLVIEDDHAAELAGVPLASLAGSTPSWAFVRSTSKPFGPDLRVALVAGDEATIARVEGRTRVTAGWVSAHLQQFVVDLWTDPAIETTVARAAHAYEERRRNLIAHLSQRGIIATGATGLNVWIPVTEESEIVTALLRLGWAVAPGARFRQTSPPAIRITVSALTPKSLPRLADAIAATLHGSSAPRYTT